MPYLWNDFGYQRGVIQGLQEQASTSSPCYENTVLLQETAVSSKSQLDFLAYGAATLTKGNTPTDVGFAISSYEFFVDLTLIFFNFYTYCTLELLLISLSNIFSKASTAFSFVSNVSFQVVAVYQGGTDNTMPLYVLDGKTKAYFNTYIETNAD